MIYFPFICFRSRLGLGLVFIFICSFYSFRPQLGFGFVFFYLFMFFYIELNTIKYSKKKQFFLKSFTFENILHCKIFYNETNGALISKGTRCPHLNKSLTLTKSLTPSYTATPCCLHQATPLLAPRAQETAATASPHLLRCLNFPLSFS